jgi:hypothetical protein
MAIEIKRGRIEKKESIPESIQLPETKTEVKKQEDFDIPKKKLLTKFHLPVLNINKEDYWPSLPLKDREHLTDKKAMDVCLGNCCGYEGLKAACCTLDPEDLEHVLGN